MGKPVPFLFWCDAAKAAQAAELFRAEIIFADTAHRAGPIGGKIFKGDIVVICGIVDIAANIANVLFHNLFPFIDYWFFL